MNRIYFYSCGASGICFYQEEGRQRGESLRGDMDNFADNMRYNAEDAVPYFRQKS